MTFKNLQETDPDHHRAISIKGGLTKRTKDGQSAWDNYKKIQEEHGAPNWLSIRQLADKYKVSKRTIVRILGKV